MTHSFERTTPEMKILKAQLKDTWVSGDFARIAESTSDDADDFVERLHLKPEMKVLDIACGTGNLSIPAARTGASVTGIDIAPNLLAEARRRAEAADLKIQFDEGDAERLPYENRSFDVVISMFGAMFAPRTDRITAELFRVCRPGGMIAMANWTPNGFIGQLYRIVGSYLPPPENVPSPFLWGDVVGLASLFGEAVSDLQCRRRLAVLSYPFDVTEAVEYWREFYGPTRAAFENIDERERRELRREMESLFSAEDVSTGDYAVIEAEYLEVMAVLKK